MPPPLPGIAPPPGGAPPMPGGFRGPTAPGVGGASGSIPGSGALPGGQGGVQTSAGTVPGGASSGPAQGAGTALLGTTPHGPTPPDMGFENGAGVGGMGFKAPGSADAGTGSLMSLFAARLSGVDNPSTSAPGIGGAAGSAGGGVLTPGGTVPGSGVSTGSSTAIGPGAAAGATTDQGFAPTNPTTVPLSGGGAGQPSTPPAPPAPPAPPPATAPGVGTPAPSALTSAPTAQFGAQPGENLIGTEINPTASPNTSAFQADTAKLGNEITNNRPDLTAATKAAYDSWITEQNPVFQKAMRDAEAQAAATGSLGSGQLETGLGSLADQFAREAMAAETSGELNAKQQDFSNTVTGAGALSNLEGQSFGQDTANANALRGERGYQEGLQQTAVGNAAAQENQQLAAQAQQADLAMKEAELGLSTTPASFKAGMGDTYANQGQQAAQTGGNVAGQGSYMDAFARMKAAMDGGGTAGGGGAPTDTGGVGTGGAFGNAGQPSPTSGATPLGNGLYQQADGTVIDENGNPVLPAYAGGDTQNNFATV